MQSLNLGHLIIAFNVLGILGILILLIAYLREKKSKENSEKTIVKEQKHSSENPNSKKANHKKDLEELDQLLKSETPREEIHSEDFSTQNLEIEILSEKIIDEIEIKDESEEVFLDLSQNNETTEEENNENRAKGKDDEESEQEYEEKERTYTLSLHIAQYASIEIIPEDRMENLKELLTVAKRYDNDIDKISALSHFLEDIALLQDTDDLLKAENRVTLMTMHASKGLEYPVIFMIGLEEGLFPQNRAITNPIELEEERRLCYVAITRAKERLFITHARFRNIFGSLEVNLPSRFIAELPSHAINHHADNANYYSDDTEEKIFY